MIERALGFPLPPSSFHHETTAEVNKPPLYTVIKNRFMDFNLKIILYMTVCQINGIFCVQQRSLTDTQRCIILHPLGISVEVTCHRPSIMARRSSPLLLALGDWSPDTVNSPMILASSALACRSWKKRLSTNHKVGVDITGTYTSLQ